MNKNTISEIKVTYTHPTHQDERITIRSSKDANNAFSSVWDHDLIELQEEFKVLLLNRANQVLGIYHVSKGSISGTVVDTRMILAVALKANACSIILAHNHPSGNLRPSEADKTLTKKIVEAGKLVDINVLDHLIITREAYCSLADEGMIS
ncbi:MAG: JAB domain-containing protein [Bacteroidetes bacterium]|nr:JAB domain-containing protein [Bacteroidota bacterium]